MDNTYSIVVANQPKIGLEFINKHFGLTEDKSKFALMESKENAKKTIELYKKWCKRYKVCCPNFEIIENENI